MGKEWGKNYGSANDLYLYCNSCNRATNHHVRCQDSFSDFDDRAGEERGLVQIVSCGGCDALCLREYTWLAGFPDCSHERLLPPRHNISSSQLYLRDEVYQLPESIQRIYQECVTAAQSGMPTLAVIGIRTILERICKEKVTEGKSLLEFIDNLLSHGLTTPEGAAILHGIRLLGNDAAHEAKPPTEKQILVALQAIDHLLLGLYVLPVECKAAGFPQQKSRGVDARR